jgi:chromosome segregation ATPase
MFSASMEDPQPSTSALTAHDHRYVVEESPRKLKRQYTDIVEQMDKAKKKLKLEKQKVRRLRRKVDSLSDVVDELRSKNLVSDNCVAVLEKMFYWRPTAANIAQVSKMQGY